MKWIESLKLAIINENVDQVVELYEKIPEFTCVEELKQAGSMIEAAISFLEHEKNKTALILKRIETVKKYGNGVQGHPSINKLT